LTVQVPDGVTAGQITVTVNGITVSSGDTLVFTPAPVAVVSSVLPDGAVAGATLPNVVVTGTRLNGAIFGFPDGATAQTKTTSDTVANLQVTALNKRGVFPLVATNEAGSSPSKVTDGNRFIVMISPDEADGPVLSVLKHSGLRPANSAAEPTNLSNQAASKVVSVLNMSLTGDPRPMRPTCGTKPTAPWPRC